VNQFDFKVVVNFAAQVANINIHDIGLVVNIIIPDVLGNLCAGKDALWFAQKTFQNGKFFGGEFDGFIAALDAARQRIEREVGLFGESAVRRVSARRRASNSLSANGLTR
jgi:hypothetical protein